MQRYVTSEQVTRWLLLYGQLKVAHPKLFCNINHYLYILRYPLAGQTRKLPKGQHSPGYQQHWRRYKARRKTALLVVSSVFFFFRLLHITFVYSLFVRLLFNEDEEYADDERWLRMTSQWLIDHYLFYNWRGSSLHVPEFIVTYRQRALFALLLFFVRCCELLGRNVVIPMMRITPRHPIAISCIFNLYRSGSWRTGWRQNTQCTLIGLRQIRNRNQSSTKKWLEGVKMEDRYVGVH